MPAMDAAAVARSYFEAIARRDLDAVAGHWDPEVVVDFTGLGVYRGADEMRDFFAGLFGAIPDVEMTARRVVGGEGVAVVEWRMHGNFTGSPLLGIDATGGWVEQRGCDVIEVSDDGKITRNTAYMDGMELGRSLGMLPPLDSPAERAMKQAFNLATKARLALRERFG
jgi:steroid delta-isomerase-like uncharacterized protein